MIQSQVEHVSQISHQDNYKQIKPKQAIKALLSQLVENEIQYILEMKTINLILKINFENARILTQDEHQFIFGEIPTIIQFHDKFLSQLEKQRQQQQKTSSQSQINQQNIKQNLKFSTGILNFVQFLQIYNDYVSRTSRILQKLQQISQNYPAFISEIQSNYKLELQIRDYFTLPLQKILSYNKIFDTYLQYLDGQQRQLCLKYQKKYHAAVKAIKKCIPNSCDKDIKQELMIAEKFSDLLQQRKFKLQKTFDVARLSHPNCSAYIVTLPISPDINKLFVFFVEKNKSIMKSIRIDYIQYGQNSFIVDKPSSFYYKYKLLLVGINKSLFILFRNSSDKQVFISLISVTKTISRFPDNDLTNMPYQAKVHTFYLLFKVIGVSQHSSTQDNRYYSIKVVLTAFFDYSQIIHLKWIQIEGLLAYFSKVYSIQFPDYGMKAVFKNVNNQQIEAKKVLRIEEIFNSLVRMEQVRRRPEYLFFKLGVSENLWMLSLAENYKRMECHSSKCSGLEPQKLDEIVNYYSQFPKQLIPNSNFFLQQYNKCSINPFLWIIAAQSLYSLLYKKKQNLIHSKKSIVRKTQYWNSVNYRDKIIYAQVVFKEINQRMNPKIKQLSHHKIIKINIYDVNEGVIEKKIYHNHHENKIDTMIMDLGWILGLDRMTQFGLFSVHKINGKQYLFDRSEKIEKLLNDGFETFTLKKIILLPLQVEKQLLTKKNIYQKKIKIYIGEIIHRIKIDEIQIQEIQLIKILGYVLSFFNNLNKLTKLELIQIINRLTPKRLEYLQNSFEKIIIYAKNYQNISEVKRYLEILEIVSEYQAYNMRLYNCKIWKAVQPPKNRLTISKQIINIQISDNLTENNGKQKKQNNIVNKKYYSLHQIEMGINYKMLMFRNSHQNRKYKQQNIHNYGIPLEIFHSDYEVFVMGNAITIKIKNNQVQEKQLHLVCTDSLQIWRLITIYKGILWDI